MGFSASQVTTYFAMDLFLHLPTACVSSLPINTFLHLPILSADVCGIEISPLPSIALDLSCLLIL